MSQYQHIDNALATTIGGHVERPTRAYRADELYQTGDGDVMIRYGSMTVAVDDVLALLAVTMAAIKFGHPPDVLAAATSMVNEFSKEPTP